MPAKECVFYKQLKEDKVQCLACQHYCVITPGKVGVCGVRKNIEGKLFLMVYGKVIAENIDPVEKKPLYHFLPGSKAYSVGTIGCNFKCSFCQNYDISQESNTEKGLEVTASKIVQAALKTKCESIAYTYTEPTIAIEFWIEVMKLAKKKGLKNILVTNGYTSKEVMKKIYKLVDASNIDLKAFSEKFYSTICKAKLAPVLETIKLSKKLGIWVELTTLIVTNKNDSMKEIEEVAKFVKSVDPNMPLHLSKYFPTYKMTEPPTPMNTLTNAFKICKKHLNHVYLGNIKADNNTYCSKCNTLLIRRDYELTSYLNGNKCPKCKKELEGVFK